MAIEKKIDCVILGLLNHNELTGYEIKKQIDTTLKYFWGASFGSIYPTLAELVNQNFAIRRDGSDNRRNKVIYTITDEGRSYLKNWLKQPVEKDEMRYETMLKLYFGNDEDESHLIDHINAFQAKIKKEIPQLLDAEKTLQQKIATDKTHKYNLLTVKFGIQAYKANLDWCKEARKILEKNRR